MQLLHIKHASTITKANQSKSTELAICLIQNKKTEIKLVTSTNITNCNNLHYLKALLRLPLLSGINWQNKKRIFSVIKLDM